MYYKIYCDGRFWKKFDFWIELNKASSYYVVVRTCEAVACIDVYERRRERQSRDSIMINIGPLVAGWMYEYVCMYAWTMHARMDGPHHLAGGPATHHPQRAGSIVWTDSLHGLFVWDYLSLPNSSAISIVFFSNNKLANRTHIPPLYMLHCYLMHACVLYSTHSTAVVDFAYIYIYIYIHTHYMHAVRAPAGHHIPIRRLCSQLSWCIQQTPTAKDVSSLSYTAPWIQLTNLSPMLIQFTKVVLLVFIN